MNVLGSFSPLAIINGLHAFLQTGGPVLAVIMAATFALWALIVERYWYFWTGHAAIADRACREWADRADHASWHAHQIRRALIGAVQLQAEQNLGLIKGLVAVAPLLGLLGTVTGMVEVFDVMAVTGASNARLMAAGVAKATIPTMAGMVVSITGLFFSSLLNRRARREIQQITDNLEIRHA